MIVTQLSAVNACLAIMGEAPLNALTEDHQFRETALRILADNSANVQAKGWWFNTENLVLRPSPTDGRIMLPGDTLDLRMPGGRFVQRGRYLFDTQEGGDGFDARVRLDAVLIRELPLDELPRVAASLIERKTVMDFQNQYDGDQTKTRNLAAEVQALLVELTAQHIRAAGHNMTYNNVRLYRIRNLIGGGGERRISPGNRVVY